MDLNLAVLCGRLATPPEVRTYDSGTISVRLLVTTRPERTPPRVDVLPVTYWEPNEDELTGINAAAAGDRIWVAGAVQRRFWESPDNGRRSRLEVIAEQVTFGDSSL